LPTTHCSKTQPIEKPMILFKQSTFLILHLVCILHQ
jgi:hypothetical protein